MDTIVLGRTGLEVSVSGLGCGGHSRLGQSSGASIQDSVNLVRRALDLGITYVDTASAYGTEEIVGQGLVGRRDEVVVSTKAQPTNGDVLLGPPALRASVEASLRRLRTDRIEVFHLHGVTAELYTHCVDWLVPELERLRDEGKIRFLAISERFAVDPAHDMLQGALRDDYWDVAMVGFNLLNPSARHRVLPLARDKNVGVEVMFAVRRALSSPDGLRQVVQQLVDDSRIERGTLDTNNPLGFVVRQGGAVSVIEAAYRFARHEPGCHVVLTGTGNADHLEQNVASIDGAPLPLDLLERLDRHFGHLDHLSGN